MDERIRQLSSEEIHLLEKYTEAVITEEGAENPLTLKQEDVSTVTAMTPPELVSSIYHMQPEKRLLIVACTETQRELASVLCKTFKEHHPAIYYNGLWEADKALAEMHDLENLLTDEDGNILSLSEEIVTGVFITEDGSLVVSKESDVPCEGTMLHKKTDDVEWGILLPMKRDMLAGTADTAPGSFFTRTLAAANLMQQVNERADNHIPVAGNTLVFHDGTCLTTAWVRSDNLEVSLRSLFFQLLFGAEDADKLGLMLTALQNAEGIPESFVNDMERIYLNDAECSTRRWNNLFERLVLDYQEQNLI